MTEEKPPESSKQSKPNPWAVSDQKLRTNWIAEGDFSQSFDGKIRTEVKKESKDKT